MPEVQRRLKEDNVDICMIQETKLKESMRTPKVTGYTAVRLDRPGDKKGGGLLTFVKDDIQFKQIPIKKDPRTTTIEAQCIQISTRALGMVNLMNLYAPPFRRCGESDETADPFRTGNIQRRPNTLYVGDINAHSDMWDSVQIPDGRGTEVEQWLMEDNLVCLNDDSPTRVNQGTGGLSSPDTTFAPSAWTGRTEWYVGEDLGSDHLPLMIKIALDAAVLKAEPPRTTWSWAKADWVNYAEMVDQLLKQAPDDASINIRAKCLTEAMLQAAKKHVGQVTIRRKAIDWMTPELLAAIKERNRLRKDIANSRKEWIEQCRKVADMTRAAKQEQWRRYIENIGEGSDAAQTWKVIKSLSGTPNTNGRNEVLKHNGKTFATAEKKATIFMQHYAKTSRLRFNKSERDVIRQVKKRLRAEDTDPEAAQMFNKEELKTAMGQMKDRSASGEDEISPRFIKNLSPNGHEFLLRLVNDSWNTSFCPQSWRTATIIPLLKANKPACKLDSYRPVSLTSCIAKTMERMVANRLHHLAEEAGWWTDDQAGFRTGRCTEDQIIRISQDISDGFQKRPMERSILALLDYSKAYDTVWREKLLLNMLEKGVPMRFINWIRGFLRNQMAAVQIDNQTGKKFILKQGLPQGAVLSPLLFLFFINPVREVITETAKKAKVSMYADDLAVWSNSRNKEEATAEVRKALVGISEWSKANKLSLNANKSEVAFFSTDSHEAKWQPDVEIDGERIRVTDNPVFLGITFDRTLSFKPQAEKVAAKAKRRANVLAACAGQDWGWKKEYLKMAYKGNVKSVMDYGAAGWQPWLAKSNMDLLERAQNCGLRRITGQMKTTPVEALRLEAGIQSYRTESEIRTAISYEKAKRLTRDHPRAKAVSANVKHRSKIRSSWRNVGEQLTSKCDEKFKGFKEAKRQPIGKWNHAPWRWAKESHWQCHARLKGGCTKASAPEALKADAEDTIQRLGEGCNIFTDGSATDGWRDGGSAAVMLEDATVEQGTRISLRAKGRRWTSSFETEIKAMRMAVQYMRDKGSKAATICTDSQALVNALSQQNKKECKDMKTIRQELTQLEHLPGEMRIQWVPGHSGLPGNAAADAEANAAARGEDLTEEYQEDEEISLNAAKSIIKQSIKDEKTAHPILQYTYSAAPKYEPKSRREAVTLAQLRSGHHLNLQACKAVIKDSDPTCPRCGEEPETLEHWMRECPATLLDRQRIFGSDKPDLSVLNSKEEEVLRYVEKTLLPNQRGEAASTDN